MHLYLWRPLTCPSLLLLPERRSSHPPLLHQVGSVALSSGHTWSIGWFWDCNTPLYQCSLSRRAIHLVKKNRNLHFWRNWNILFRHTAFNAKKLNVNNEPTFTVDYRVLWALRAKSAVPITYIFPLSVQAADPERAICIGATSVHKQVLGLYTWARSVPSPSSRTAPPVMTHG